MTTITATDISALILAGGQGSRMGGADKGLQLLHGRPLISHVLNRVRAQVATVIVSANRNVPEYQRLGVTVVTDSSPDYPGPLAGMLAGLQQCSTPWLFTCPCDAPYLAAGLVQRLADALQNAPHGPTLAVARFQGHLQPTFMLCHREHANNLAHYLASGERRVGLWQTRLNALPVDCDDWPDSFINLNSLADLQQAHSPLP